MSRNLIPIVVRPYLKRTCHIVALQEDPSTDALLQSDHNYLDFFLSAGGTTDPSEPPSDLIIRARTFVEDHEGHALLIDPEQFPPITDTAHTGDALDWRLNEFIADTNTLDEDVYELLESYPEITTDRGLLKANDALGRRELHPRRRETGPAK